MDLEVILSQKILLQIAKFVTLMFAVSLVTFFLVGMSPIDPVQANVGQQAMMSMGEERRVQLASYWGADLPIWERYLNWLVSALQGDFGTSLRYNAPVTEVVAHRAANSLLLIGSAWAIGGVLGFILGVGAGVKRGSLLDRLVKGYCYLLAATPTFWIALLMLMVFAVSLHWFPIGFSAPIGVSDADVTIFDSLYHMVLPALTLSLIGVANIALHTREKTIDVMESDYVRFARARGMSVAEAVRHHGLKNLLLPAITLQFASVSEIFGGSVLVEQVFSYPGIGQATITAGLGGDASLLVAIALVSAALVFLGNLCANVLYGVVDPRMRKGESHG